MKAMVVFPLLKAKNPGYTYTRNGKTVTVQPFNDKRPSAKANAKRSIVGRKEDTATPDMFDPLPDRYKGRGNDAGRAAAKKPKMVVRREAFADATGDLFGLDKTGKASDIGMVAATATPSPAVSGGSEKGRAMTDSFSDDEHILKPDPQLADAAGGHYWQSHNKEPGNKANMRRGAFIDEVAAGKHPDVVRDYLDWLNRIKAEAAVAAAEKAKSVQGGIAAIEGISIPGHTLSVEGEDIIVSGPFDGDLHERIKRAGGRWDGSSGKNRRVWIVPATKGKSLKRIAGNVQSSMEKKAKAAADSAEKARADAEAKAKADAQALAAARAAAPDIEPGKYGPFTVWAVEGGYRVAFPYDASRVSAIKAGGATGFRSSDKSWYVDKAKASALQLILDKAKAAHTELAGGGAAQPSAAAPRKLRRLFPVSRMPTFGRPTRLYGKPVVFTGKGDSFRINEDHPSVHGSHLLGHEGEHGAYAYYREATQEEASVLEAQETAEAAAQAGRQQSARVLGEARERIQASGEMPTDADPSGEVVHDTFNIYGGGDRFVIGPDYIWYVRNNGHDGDDWSMNNVRTGGAGAVGWRVPFSAELADKIRSAG